MDWNFLVQAIVAMLVITAPPDPIKILLFDSIVNESGQARMAAAIKVSVIVLCILGGAALGGAEIAELLGINLDVFSVVGGIVVAGMGFEMLYGGKRSKAQGQEATEQEGEDEGGLVMPLAIPLIAGPGAIVTAVAISTSNDDGLWAAVIGSIAVALLTFVSFRFLGGLLSKLSDRATALMLRLGGMLLATIGLQMLLGGLKRFFAA